MQQDLDAPLLTDPKSDTEVLLEATGRSSSESQYRVFSAKSPSRWKKLQQLIVSGVSKIGLLYTTLVSTMRSYRRLLLISAVWCYSRRSFRLCDFNAPSAAGSSKMACYTGYIFEYIKCILLPAFLL